MRLSLQQRLLILLCQTATRCNCQTEMCSLPKTASLSKANHKRIDRCQEIVDSIQAKQMWNLYMIIRDNILRSIRQFVSLHLSRLTKFLAAKDNNDNKPKKIIYKIVSTYRHAHNDNKLSALVFVWHSFSIDDSATGLCSIGQIDWIR